MLPTLKLERAALKRFYTWHCSTQGLPAIPVTRKSRELLPHIFTLTPSPSPQVERGIGAVIFCGTFSFPMSREAPFNTGWVALRCPDFPSQINLERWPGFVVIANLRKISAVRD